MRACMARLIARYDDAYSRQLYHLESSSPHHFPHVRDWFKARYDVLCSEFADAIIENDSIIGKQWHFNYYTKTYVGTGWFNR